MSCSEVVSPLEGEKSCVRWGLVDEGGGVGGRRLGCDEKEM
jgi:hypothetical protein